MQHLFLITSTFLIRRLAVVLFFKEKKMVKVLGGKKGDQLYHSPRIQRDVTTQSCQALAKNQTNVSALNIRNTLHCRYCEIFLRLQKSLFLNLITPGAVSAVFYFFGMHNVSLKSDWLNITFIIPPVLHHLAQSRTAKEILQLLFIGALRFHNICSFRALL